MTVAVPLRINEYRLMMNFDGLALESKIMMPRGANVLAFDVIDEVPTIWAEVDPTARLVERKFYVLTTGCGINKPTIYQYIGTAYDYTTRQALHCYENLGLE